MIFEVDENTSFEASFSLFALNIIKAKGKKVFSGNRALNCLTKSDYFFKELSVLYSQLFYSDISPSKFLEMVDSIDTSSVDKERLILFSKLYSSYIEIMNSNGYKIPVLSIVPKEISQDAKNAEIQKRVDFLINTSEGKKEELSFLQESENISYLEFSDIQNESLYIIQEIKKLVANGKGSYGDFAVFVDKTEARQKFLDLMKIENLPVVSSIYNEDYENLKHKISVYQKISDICLHLKLEGFASEEFKNIDLASKAEKEIYLAELDEILKGLLAEIITDDYVLDKICSQKENTSKTFLESVYSSWHSFSDVDKEALIQEFSAIKNFYESYKELNFAKAIESVLKRYFVLFENTDVKAVAAGKIKSLNELQSLYDMLGDMPDFASFKEIMEWLPRDKTKEKNAVYLGSISSKLSQKQNYKYIYIAGLTENNFPGNNTSYPFISEQTNESLLQAVQKFRPDFEYFLKTDEIHFSQRFESLCSLMKKAQEKITLTSHLYEAKKQALSSVFFKILIENDFENSKKIEDMIVAEEENETLIKNIEVGERQKVISREDLLKLSPSAVSTFLKCPRKYYYKTLLNLKETSTFSASYGSIVHSVFEVLNRKYLSSYNKETALELANILFDAKNDEEKVLKVGFKQNDVDLVKASDSLSLAEMKDNFKDAIEDYSMMGYFDHPPDFAVCEKSFSFKLDEFPNTIFEGRIDAILTEGEKVKIVDYKTGKDKAKSLEEAIENIEKSADYQIPMYYLACKNCDELAEFKDSVSESGYIYIRPKSKHNGCDEDFVTSEIIEANKENILKSLKENVVEKILNETEFKKVGGWDCENCSYKFLCDKDEEGADD